MFEVAAFDLKKKLGGPFCPELYLSIYLSIIFPNKIAQETKLVGEPPLMTSDFRLCR